MDAGASLPWWGWAISALSIGYTLIMMRDAINRDEDRIRGGKRGPWLIGMFVGGPLWAMIYQVSGRVARDDDAPEAGGVDAS